MQKITTYLWFNDQAEEAIDLYVSLFPDSRILDISRLEPDGPGGPTKVVTINFELMGQEFIALNGGPQFQFTPAISLLVRCKDQVEVDHYWDRLLEGGGEEDACGWLRDRFGLSWQIIPDALWSCLNHPAPAKAQRAMQAMLQMKKIDVAALEAAVAD